MYLTKLLNTNNQRTIKIKSIERTNFKPLLDKNNVELRKKLRIST